MALHGEPHRLAGRSESASAAAGVTRTSQGAEPAASAQRTSTSGPVRSALVIRAS